jgi:transposase-like protein
VNYTNGFKEAVVKKMLEPGARSVTELSHDLGVSEQMLCNWRNRCRVTRNEDVRRTPRQWTAQERYNATLHAASLSDVSTPMERMENGCGRKVFVRTILTHGKRNSEL